MAETMIPSLKASEITVRPLTPADILEVIGAGIRDFRAAPGKGLAIAAIYVFGGWLMILMLVRFDLPFLVYPLAAGFALIAPWIATAFYAVSDRIERGEAADWGPILGALKRATGRDLGWMAVVTGFALFIWMDIAALMFFGFFGLSALNLSNLLDQMLTTPSGWVFLLVGNGAGAVISFAVFSISVTSFPLLYDRDVDFVTAMITSVRTVATSPLPLALWCATIAVTVGLSLLSGLVGLFIVLPVLGHASWHLYRRAVVVERT